MFIAFVSTIVVSVTEIGWLYADVCVGAFDTNATAVDGKTGTSAGTFVADLLVVAVVVSIADLALVDAMAIAARKRSFGTYARERCSAGRVRRAALAGNDAGRHSSARRRAIQLITAVSAVVDVIAS